MKVEARLDTRTERTRRALLQAFAQVVLERPYESIQVADIAASANLSRSTFYEHFRGKDALLAASISGPFGILARCVGASHDPERLLFILEHFWENRAHARAILVGSVRRTTASVLVVRIEEELQKNGIPRSGVLLVPRRLAAVQLAEILLAPITAWLMGESRCEARVLAEALRRVARATVAALRTPAAVSSG